MSPHVVRQLLQTAFDPLWCGVDFARREDRLSVRVYDAADEPVLSIPDLGPAMFDDRLLATLIRNARQDLAARGYALTPWGERAPD